MGPAEEFSRPQGYADAKAGGTSCESVPDDCPYSTASHPIAAQACKVDASDLPFLYYEQFADGSHTRDYAALHDDLAGGAEPAGLERRPAWAVASGFGVGRPASAPVREDP